MSFKVILDIPRNAGEFNTTMFNILLKYLEKTGYEYFVNPKVSSVTFLAKMDNYTFHCTLEVKESLHLIACYTSISIMAPEKKRSKVAELITRLNYQLPIGNFEMDFESGEIRFKTSLDFESIHLADKLLDNLIGANLTISDEYIYAITETIISNLSPREIVEKCVLEEEHEVLEAVLEQTSELMIRQTLD